MSQLECPVKTDDVTYPFHSGRRLTHMNDLSPAETLNQALRCDCTRGTISRVLVTLVLVFAYRDPAPTALGQSKPGARASKDYAKTADALMSVYAQAGRFACTVLVAQHGAAIFRKAYGFANREWSIPNTLETKFRIASVTKQFTAAAIPQLREQGNLSLDDPVSKYYKGAPSAWASITLESLRPANCLKPRA
jgi:CubicO group peptidase (beta-lactamase class C family)